MRQHFVTFYSPGTFVAESSTKSIHAWDPALAKEMAREIKERYNAVPYGFRFTTRAREDNELDSKEVAHSCMYFLGGKVRTIEEVEADNLPDEQILRSNMRCNNYKRIITNDNSWRWTQPIKDDDVVLDWP